MISSISIQKHIVLIIAMVALNIGSLYSQVASSIPVTLIGREEGLLNFDNFFMYKDSRGLVWIGSRSGLYRYDGKTLKLYLPDPEDQPSNTPNHIHSHICEDGNGDLWFGTWRGISCYIRSSDTFKSYTLPGSSAAFRFFVCGLDQLHQLWFTHGNKIYTLQTVTGHIESRSDFNEALWNSEFQLDEDGEVKFIYSYNRYKNFPGLYIDEFNAYQHVRSTSILRPPEFDSMAVSDVHVLGDKSLLLATSSGLYIYEPVSSSLHHFQPRSITGPWPVNAITTWNDTLVFIGTKSDGYYTFNSRTNSLEDHYEIAMKDANINDAPLSMYTDQDGGIWIYVQKRGVVYFHPRNLVFKHYPIVIDRNYKSESLKVGCLVEFDAQTVFASSESSGGYFIHSKDGGIDRPAERCKNCPSSINPSFRDSKGRIWMNAQGRLFVMDAKKNVIPVKSVKLFGAQMSEMNDGTIITTSGGDIYSYNDQKIGPISFSKIILPDSNFKYSFPAMHTDGLLYLYGTLLSKNTNTIIAFDPRDGFRKIRTIPIQNGYKGFQAIEGSNDFIVGTRFGPYYFDAKNEKLSRIDFARYGHDYNIWGIVQLEHKEYLLCGENSVGIIDLNHQQSRYFGLENGLGMKGVDWFAYLRRSNGDIWLGNAYGISIGKPDHLEVPELLSKVNITSIQINDRSDISFKSDDRTKTNPNEIKSLSLHHKFNTLSFEFASLSYAGMNADEYEYRLTGLEQNWVNGGKQGFARYANLRAGNYMFEVRVKDNPKSVRTLMLKIIPPLYAKLWFFILAGVFLTFCIYQLVKFNLQRKQRIQQLKFEAQLALEHERLRISNNLHDDLGSGLSALNLRAQALAQHTQDPGIKVEANQLAENTRKLVGQIRETIWTTNAAYDTIDNLVTRLHEYTLDYFEGSGITCKVKLMPEIVTKTIPGNHRREIYLAYKEALHNIYKHARATEVNVVMRMTDENHLLISIKDNGHGFNTHREVAGLGLQSMRKRMLESGGEFRISSDSTGTFVEFDYPV